jgi:low temperature requirement protein LtrA
MYALTVHLHIVILSVIFSAKLKQFTFKFIIIFQIIKLIKMYKESVTEIKKRSRHVRENANKKQKIEKNLIFNKNKVYYHIRYDALTL